MRRLISSPLPSCLIAIAVLLTALPPPACAASIDAPSPPPGPLTRLISAHCPQRPPIDVDQPAAPIIDLNACRVPELRADMFAALPGAPAVTVLTIRAANVTRIDEAALTGLRRLQALVLAANRLDRLDQWAPHYFNALDSLDVADNRLTTVADRALRPYPNLRMVHLQGNRLAGLPDAVFEGNRRLVLVDLSGNRLQTVSSRLLVGLRRLRTLDLSGNRIDTIEAAAFADLLALETLRLGGNVLQRLAVGLLAPLRAMRQLNVSRNALQVLDVGTFGPVGGELRELNVSGNRLAELKAGWATGLELLETLDLSDNQIGQLQPLHPPLRHLVRLNCSGNRLSELAADTLANHSALESLDLSANRIERIATEAFATLPQLHFLDLGSNQLDTENFLQPVRALRHLSLAHNHYHTMNLTTFFHFHNVNLAGNPWSCTWLIEEMMVAAEGIYFGKDYSIVGGSGAEAVRHPMTVPGIDCTDEAGQLRNVVVLQVPEKKRNAYGERITDETSANIAISPADSNPSVAIQNKSIRKLLDDEFDYKACLIWTAVAVIAVFSIVHLGKVFFARSEKNSEKYRISQQVGLLGNIETTLSIPRKSPAYPTSGGGGGGGFSFPQTPSTAQTPLTPMTPMTPLTPMTPMSPMTPLTPITPPLTPNIHRQQFRGSSNRRSAGDRRPQHNVYFARPDHETTR